MDWFLDVEFFYNKIFQVINAKRGWTIEILLPIITGLVLLTGLSPNGSASCHLGTIQLYLALQKYHRETRGCSDIWRLGVYYWTAEEEFLEVQPTQ